MNRLPARPEFNSTTTWPRFIGFGNVLMDHSARLESDAILHKHDLDPNAEGELSSEKVHQIIEDIKKDSVPVVVNPGGSALNTCRTLIGLNEPNTCFFGAVGNDFTGWRVKDKCNKKGLPTCLQIINNVPTGICICIARNEKRSCYANIGASKYFEKSFLESQFFLYLSEGNRQAIYVEGFFVPGRFEVCEYLYENACKNKASKDFVINLSSPYIVRGNPDHMKWICEKADIVIGNVNEFGALMEIYNHTNPSETVQHICRGNTYKLVIITDGPNPVQLWMDRVGKGTMERLTYEVPQLDKKQIVDTTGAGDSFVAGFFHGYVYQKIWGECIRMGIAAAARTIGVIGGSFHDKLVY